MRALIWLSIGLYGCAPQGGGAVATPPTEPVATSLGLVSDIHGITLDVGPGVATFTAGDAVTSMRLVEPALADLDPAWQDTRIARAHAGLTETWWAAEDGVRLQVELAEITSPTLNLRWTLDGDAARDPAEVVALGQVALTGVGVRDANEDGHPATASLSCNTDGCVLSVEVDLTEAIAPVAVGLRWANPAVSEVWSLAPGVDGYTTAGSILAGSLPCYLDADEDGFGDPASPGVCGDEGYVANDDDCDDADNTSFPGAVEIASDNVDQDCSGADALWDMDDLVAGDLVITEIMVNPNAVADDYGEWFEFENRSGLDVSLSGLYVRDGRSPPEQGNLQTLNVGPGDRIVVGQSMISSQNGGIVPDALMPPNASAGVGGATWSLGNSGDQIRIMAGVGGLEFDRVIYTTGSTWGYNTGVSTQLDPDFIDATQNNTANRWCASTPTFGLGDLGTPGLANLQCSSAPSTPTPPVSTPPASLCFEYEYTNATTGEIIPDPLLPAPVIEITFAGGPTSGTFETDNAGTGTWTSGHNASGIWVVFTYDVTGAVYRGIKPTAGVYSGQIRIGHPWTGTWTEVSCPP